MTRYRLFQCMIFALIGGFCICGHSALAQPPHHFQVRTVPRAQPASTSLAVAVPAALFPLWQAFTTYTIDPNTGADEWPCNGGQAECPTINPLGLVVGSPDNIWSLSACTATSTSSPNCGQAVTWYEDNTNDTTDDLIYIFTATQVQNGSKVYVYDSGTEDFGLAYVGAGFPHRGGLYGDSNFGTMGEAGKNNGNCYADYNYPYPTLPGYFSIAANRTCVDPVPGPVDITATTELATPTWTYKNGVPYEVKYTVTYKIVQKWTIYLE